MNTSQILPALECPRCHALLDGLTSVCDGEDDVSGGAARAARRQRPAAGSITVCIHCGALLRFGESMQLEMQDESILAEIARQSPVKAAVLDATREFASLTRVGVRESQAAAVALRRLDGLRERGGSGDDWGGS